MEVAVSELRAHLSHWLARAGEGDEVVVTERGLPVARILGVDAQPRLARLADEGVIGRPAQSRPAASGHRRARAAAPVSEWVSEQRR